MVKQDINNKLWDYTICLENAIREINKTHDYKSVFKADSNDLISKEVDTLRSVESDLRRIIDDDNNKTYWDYLNVGEDDE